MKLTILGGKEEIGGNKILVEHKGTKVLLDFGMSMKLASKYFSEFLQPRKASSLLDFFELGLLPDIKGLYRNDYLTHMGRKKEEREIDAVLLSHAHADHAQYIHFLRNDIPIYCTKPTKIILQVLEELGNSSFSDLVTSLDMFVFRPNKTGGMSRVTRKDAEFIKERDYKIMDANKEVKIGCLEVEMVPVDHSVPGSCGFIIHSDEGTLVYTGDIRFHGSNKSLSEHFVQKAKAVKPKWLLCEGTRINSKDKNSEEEVKKKISDFISKAKGLVFVEHPIRDLDRVVTMFKAAKENKREFVVTLKLAYLIQSLGDICPFTLEEVKILVPKKGWGLICKDNIDCKLVEQDYEQWEREFIHRKNDHLYGITKTSNQICCFHEYVGN